MQMSTIALRNNAMPYSLFGCVIVAVLCVFYFFLVFFVLLSLLFLYARDKRRAKMKQKYDTDTLTEPEKRSILQFCLEENLCGMPISLKLQEKATEYNKQRWTATKQRTTTTTTNVYYVTIFRTLYYAASSFCVFFLFLFMCLRLICCASVMPVQRRKKWMRLNKNHLQPTQVYTCMQMRQSCGATCIRYNVCVRLLFDKLNFEHSQHRAASTE